MSTDPMKVTLLEQKFIGAPEPRETIYRQGIPSAGGAYPSYRISVAEGREWAHHTLLHFVQSKPNQQDFGITNESLIAVAIDRLEHFQKGPFPCAEADEALEHLRKGLAALKARAERRFKNGTVGKHEEAPYTPVVPVSVEASTDEGDADSKTVEGSPEGNASGEGAETKPEAEKEAEPETGDKSGAASTPQPSVPHTETTRRRQAK